ncbi:MAG: hypothetical protein ABEJ64_00565 [Candidatus Nanohaloarchaea archaeon]
MEFEKYDPEKHGSWLYERVENTAVEPGNVEEYRDVIWQGLEDIRDVFGISSSFRIVFAETDLGKVEKLYGENPPFSAYYTGMSLPGESRAPESLVFLKTTDEIEGWRSGLKYFLAHEVAHQEFFTKRRLQLAMPVQMLFEGHAMHFSEKVSEEKGYGWGVRMKDIPEAEAGELKHQLDKKRNPEDTSGENVSGLLDSEDEKWGDGKGYRITFYLVDDVMDRRDLSVWICSR